MSLESSLWGWLYRVWKDVKGLHFTRIENSASSGTPDVEGCTGGLQFWIELKIAKRPKHRHDIIKLDHFRVKQVVWLHNRWLVDGRAWVLVRVEGNGPRVHYLLSGGMARALYEGMTEDAMDEVSWIDAHASPMDVLRRASVW